MPRVYKICRRSLVLIVPATVVLALMLAGCGSSATGSSYGGSAANPAPTIVKGDSTTQGCPDNVTLNPPPPAPTIIVNQGHSQTTVDAHTGDTIEIQLPASRKWTGPTASQGNLELQMPYGYVSPEVKMCSWRFVAKGSGMTTLSFEGRAICNKGQMCPEYILSLPFTIEVK